MPNCEVCGEPMAESESMFKFHGYSGPCPKPPMKPMKYDKFKMWPKDPRPTIVCLCGSTRFWEKFRDEGLRLTLDGKIVLSIGVAAPDSMVLANPESEEGKAQKARLDVLHKQKIDLADEVLVLNVGGYIGSSTRGEVQHAFINGKPVRWLEPDKIPADFA